MGPTGFCGVQALAQRCGTRGGAGWALTATSHQCWSHPCSDSRRWPCSPPPGLRHGHTICEAAVAPGPPQVSTASPGPMVGWHGVQTLLHQYGPSSLRGHDRPPWCPGPALPPWPPPSPARWLRTQCGSLSSSTDQHSRTGSSCPCHEESGAAQRGRSGSVGPWGAPKPLISAVGAAGGPRGHIPV